MADPKYADLPGIVSIYIVKIKIMTNYSFQAHDEPDVYENLPESEQDNSFFVPENCPVERIHISSEEAFNKFKGKFLNAANVDFSDSINKQVKTGYDCRSGDWELVGPG